MDITKPINTISFFKGYGGIERGIELIGERIRSIASCEIEAYAIANLIAKMEEGSLDPHPIWTNAKTFPGEQFLGKVDLFTGGFPCQPFSAAGGRKADEDPRHLWPACIRAIESFRPHRVFFENVEGLISAKLGGDEWSDPKGTPVLLHVCRELERRGYKTTWGVFSASEAGAPHQRKRVFILGKLEDTESQQSGWDTLEREEQRQSKPISSSVKSRAEELANSECGDGQNRLRHKNCIESAREGKTTEFTRSYNSKSNFRPCQRQERVMAHPHHKRLEGSLPPKQTHCDQWCKQVETSARCSYIWPTRPGQQQGPMEEPRVKSKLGRATNGVNNRIDRLRLLGNGVVPQTAAIAWEVLNERLEQ